MSALITVRDMATAISVDACVILDGEAKPVISGLDVRIAARGMVNATGMCVRATLAGPGMDATWRLAAPTTAPAKAPAWRASASARTRGVD